jgi:hypothetical protein
MKGFKMKAEINIFGGELINIECESRQVTLFKNLVALAIGVGELAEFDGSMIKSQRRQDALEGLFEALGEAIAEVKGGKISSYFYFNEILIDVKE